MQTIVPIGTFEGKARKLLGDIGFDDLISNIAIHPEAGDVIRGTGGLRKIRVARPGKGKSGGARVIYYYHSKGQPILLLLIYAKADQGNMTASQKAEYKKLVEPIIEAID